MGRRKSRKLISTHSLLIILCLLLIAVSVHMLFSEEDEEKAQKFDEFSSLITSDDDE